MMPSTATVVWSSQWSEGTHCGAPPSIYQVGLLWGTRFLAGTGGEAEPALGFLSQARMKCFFSSWLFFL